MSQMNVSGVAKLSKSLRGEVVLPRSGGHSFAGYGVCEDGLVIDLSLMKRAVLDPVHERIRIEPGILAGELDCLTQSFRMAVPLGSCPTVGVAGYALGGGESSLTPKFGYGCDSLMDLEVVTADSKVLRQMYRSIPTCSGRCAAPGEISA
jgi:FAD/FMN-containing dehydrogenase